MGEYYYIVPNKANFTGHELMQRASQKRKGTTRMPATLDEFVDCIKNTLSRSTFCNIFNVRIEDNGVIIYVPGVKKQDRYDLITLYLDRYQNKPCIMFKQRIQFGFAESFVEAFMHYFSYDLEARLIHTDIGKIPVTPGKTLSHLSNEVRFYKNLMNATQYGRLLRADKSLTRELIRKYPSLSAIAQD